MEGRAGCSAQVHRRLGIYPVDQMGIGVPGLGRYERSGNGFRTVNRRPAVSL